MRTLKIVTASAFAFLSLAAAGGVWLVTESAAHACGMPERPVTGTPADRLALAEKNLKGGYNASAFRVARTVLTLDGASDPQKAEAHAIVGWINWASGAHEKALAEFKLARDLDPASIPVVLALSTDRKITEELKKALEA